MERNGNGISPLDQMRNQHEKDRYREVFFDIGKKERGKAIGLINDNRLRFLSFFLLLPEIEALDLYRDLSKRNISALVICAKILKNKTLLHKAGDKPLAQNSADALRWVLKTGAPDDGFNNDFDRILDGAALILIKTYRDKSVFPFVVDMIFKRNEKGFFNHDLIWAIFETHDPDILRLIARHLRSDKEADLNFACKLLNFKKPLNPSEKAGMQKQYYSYLAWLKENEPYLYFTGENSQSMSNPARCRVNLDAKYLCRPVMTDCGDPVAPLNERDCRCLECFHDTDDEEKLLLCRYSNQIHRRNIQFWNQWINKPIREQINAARGRPGGN